MKEMKGMECHTDAWVPGSTPSKAPLYSSAFAITKFTSVVWAAPIRLVTDIVCTPPFSHLSI